MNEVETRLKQDLKAAAISQKEAASFLNMKYVTFNNSLNGFSSFTAREKLQLQGFIDQRLKAQEQLSRAEAGIQSLESSK